MILLDADNGSALSTPRLSWETPSAAMVSGSDPWSRSSRRLIEEVRDEDGHRLPLRGELWVTVYPPRGDKLWRVEADGASVGVVGRGKSSEDALSDWRKRLRATTQRFLEMRPFEMTEEDRKTWGQLQGVIDVPRYKATKPIVVRQLGKIVKLRSGLTVVRWEDGARERVKPVVFDEVFSRFRVGQRFEVMVTRHPVTFRIIRAEAVRKLPKRDPSAEQSMALWDRAVGPQGSDVASLGSVEIDEGFWLNK